MTQTIELPLWAFILILLFAAVTFASHFLFPSVRWFFRKRMERAVAKLNTRLRQPIAPFKLARRYDMIQRLIYDPQVTQAIVEHAEANNVPENVAFEQARRYAREIVPSFSATAYFTVGTRLARWLSRSLYQVRIGAFDRDILDGVNTKAAVVFVMNHRSNMDYVLVTYLAARAGALSYAVGEWARVWPLSWVIRAMGAFFIRRRSRGALYRRVLARYVQMATAAGVTQAVFPEGGLSLDGRQAPPRLGLLNYIVTGFDPAGREVIFVPVALNYDRVLEDRFLIAADKSGVRRFRPPLFTVLGGLAGHLWNRVTGRFKGFGAATVGFGRPLSLGEFLSSQTGDPTEAVASELMARVRAVVPVPPVPLVARALRAGQRTGQRTGQGADLAGVTMAVSADIARLAAIGVAVPKGDPATIVDEALANLRVRGLLSGVDGALVLAPDAPDILAFYANSIEHHFTEAAVSATAKQ